MMILKEVNKWLIIERVGLCGCLISAIATTLFYCSHPGMLGLNESGWYMIWGLSNDLLPLSAILFAMAKSEKNRAFFGWVFIPFFIAKLLYHLATYGKIKIMSSEMWHNVWIFLLIDLILAGLIYCIIYHEKD